MKSQPIWSKNVFLGMGPAAYLGFLLPAMASVNTNKLSFVLLTVCGLSALYFAISFAVMKAIQKWLVPVLRKKDSLEFHAKNAGIYALFASIPATYLGAFNIAMAYGCPGGHPDFNLLNIVLLYVYGWSFGAAAGAIASAIILPVVVGTKEVFANLFKELFEQK